MSRYARKRASATRRIKKAADGVTATLIKKTNSGSNFGKPTKVPHTVHVIDLENEYKVVRKRTDSEVGDLYGESNVDLGERQFLMAYDTGAVKPTHKDILVWQGERLGITKVDTLSPNGYDIVYTLTVKSS